MKVLPDNPNLDHLRRQAKDLLTGLRESAPETSLSHAQTSLARQYGFHTWSDLKAEVDRRAGTVELADPALAQAVAAAYDLGGVTGPMPAVAPPDNLGRLWSLSTDRGRWAVYSVKDWRPIVDVESEVALQVAAADAGVALPLPIRSQSGRIVETIGARAWRVYEWKYSGPPLVTPARSDVVARIGGILGTIHRLALPVDRISPWHGRLLFEPSGILASARARGLRWASALDDALPALRELAAIGDGVPTAPPVLCHNTFGAQKVRRGPDGELIVVGWESAGGQPPVWELAVALSDWAIGPARVVNQGAVRALLHGYEAAAGGLPGLDLAAFRGGAVSLVNYVFELAETALTGTDRRAGAELTRLLPHLPSRALYHRLLDAVANVAPVASA